jgi:hypothetical protein
MIYYLFHGESGEVTSKQSRTLPLTEGMEAYNALRVEVTEEEYYRSANEFCYVDVETGLIVFPTQSPSSDHSFDYEAKQWVALLSDQKETKWKAIKRSRDAEEFGTFVWNGYTFDCDEVSQRRIQGAVQIAALDTNTVMDWTLADNTVQTFNATELQQIGQALGAHVNACHVKGREKRAQIDAATTEAELDAISW